MKRWAGVALKAGVTAGILAVVVARSDVRAILALMSSVHSRAVATALALVIGQTVVTAYRWVLVMRGMGVSTAFRGALRALFASLFLNQCLPSYVGGDAYRVYWLCRRGQRLARAFRGVLIDRVSAVVVLFAMLGASLPLLRARLDAPAVMDSVVVVFGVGLTGSVVFFAGDVLPLAWRRWGMVREVAEISSCARRVLLQGVIGLVVGILALVVHSLTAAIMYIFAADMGLPLSALDCLLLVAPITLLTAVPISIAGWGVREGVIVGALSLVGIGVDQALALSVLLGFTLLANGLIGVFPLAFAPDWPQMPRPSGGERLAGTAGRGA